LHGLDWEAPDLPHPHRFTVAGPRYDAAMASGSGETRSLP
jgi:hypothetical protein